jgi:hypothetical protein
MKVDAMLARRQIMKGELHADEVFALLRENDRPYAFALGVLQFDRGFGCA